MDQALSRSGRTRPSRLLRLEPTGRVRAGEIDVAYQAVGDPADPPVLLISGLGVQMLGWREDFCEQLAQRGCFVIRFDNRDTGLSTHLPEGSAYTLSDMASDSVGLLDSLGLESAHLAGVSMGGMVAQIVAIEHPRRVRSLTSLMSTTGDHDVGAPTQAAAAVLMSPPATTREEAMERAVGNARVLGSPGFELDEEGLRERAGIAFDRAFDPAGITRQYNAIVASGDRTEALRTLDVPTVVVHGVEDPLIDQSGGRATAAAVPGAELVLLEGVGHDLPEGLWPALIDSITAAVARGDQRRR